MPKTSNLKAGLDRRRVLQAAVLPTLAGIGLCFIASVPARADENCGCGNSCGGVCKDNCSGGCKDGCGSFCGSG